jgi:hypothetical protein
VTLAVLRIRVLATVQFYGTHTAGSILRSAKEFESINLFSERATTHWDFSMTMKATTDRSQATEDPSPSSEVYFIARALHLYEHRTLDRALSQPQYPDQVLRSASAGIDRKRIVGIIHEALELIEGDF